MAMELLLLSGGAPAPHLPLVLLPACPRDRLGLRGPRRPLSLLLPGLRQPRLAGARRSPFRERRGDRRRLTSLRRGRRRGRGRLPRDPVLDRVRFPAHVARVTSFCVISGKSGITATEVIV